MVKKLNSIISCLSIEKTATDEGYARFVISGEQYGRKVYLWIQPNSYIKFNGVDYQIALIPINGKV